MYFICLGKSFVRESKKGVTVVNNSERTKILQGYFFFTFIYFPSGILFTFKLFSSLQILKAANKQRGVVILRKIH